MASSVAIFYLGQRGPTIFAEAAIEAKDKYARAIRPDPLGASLKSPRFTHECISRGGQGCIRVAVLIDARCATAAAVRAAEATWRKLTAPAVSLLPPTEGRQGNLIITSTHVR